MSGLRSRLRGARGFTLVELVVAMPVLTILLAALVLVLRSTIVWDSRQQEQSTLQTEARAAVGTFVADLRQAYLGNGPPVASATSTAITFYSPDKQTPFHEREIAYRLVGGTLQRAVALSTNAYPSGPPWTLPALGPWATELGSITTATAFAYYDASGVVLPSPVADPSQIRSVAISLTVTTGGTQPQLTTYAATASLRETE